MSFTINMDLLNQAREDSGVTTASIEDQIGYVAPEEDVVVDIFGDSSLGDSTIFDNNFGFYDPVAASEASVDTFMNNYGDRFSGYEDVMTVEADTVASDQLFGAVTNATGSNVVVKMPTEDYVKFVTEQYNNDTADSLLFQVEPESYEELHNYMISTAHGGDDNLSLRDVGNIDASHFLGHQAAQAMGWGSDYMTLTGYRSPWDSSSDAGKGYFNKEGGNGYLQFEYSNNLQSNILMPAFNLAVAATMAYMTGNVASAISAATGLGATASNALAGGLIGAAQGGNAEEILKAAALAGVSAEVGEMLKDPTSVLSQTYSNMGIDSSAIRQGLTTTGTKLAAGSSLEEAIAAGLVTGGLNAVQGELDANYKVDPETGLPVEFSETQSQVGDYLDAGTSLQFPDNGSVVQAGTLPDISGGTALDLPDDPLGNIEASKNYVPPSGGSLEEVTVTAPSTEGGMLTGTTSVSETPLSYDEWYSQQTTPQNLYNLTDKNGNRVDGVYVRKTGETLEVVGDPYLVDQSYGASLLVNEYVPAMQDKLNSGELKIGTEAGFTPEEIQVTAAAEPETFLDNLNSLDYMQPVIKPTKPEEIVVTAPETPIEEPPLVVPELPLDIAKPLDPVIPKVTETEPEQKQVQDKEASGGGGDSSGSAGATPTQPIKEETVDLFADTTSEDTVGDTTAEPTEQPQTPTEQPQAPTEQPQAPAGEPQPTYDDGYNTGFTEGAGSVQQQYIRTGENEWQDAEGNVYKYETVGSYDSGYNTGYTDGAGSVVQKWEKTGDNEYTDAEGNVFTYEELGSYDTGYDTGYGAAQEVSPWQQNLENPNEWTNVLTGETVVTEAAGSYQGGYDTGYGLGEEAGYTSGWEAEQKNSPWQQNPENPNEWTNVLTGETLTTEAAGSYDSGYGTGYGEGNEVGYTTGYGEGETVGYGTGYGEGYGTGYGEGEGAGFGRGQGVATTSQSFAGGDMPEFQGYMGGLAYRKLTPYQLQDLIYQPSVVNSLFGDYLK